MWDNRGSMYYETLKSRVVDIDTIYIYIYLQDVMRNCLIDDSFELIQ